MSRAEYDCDTIRDRLTVAAVLRVAGDEDIDENTRRMTCPIHEGASNPSEFSVFAAGRAYTCFSCGAKGDALTLMRWIWKEPFAATLARAAALVGVTPGPVDPASRARSNAQRERRRELQAEAQRIRNAESTRISTNYWSSLLGDQWSGTRWAHLYDYLCVRRLDRALARCDGFGLERRIYTPADPRLAQVLVPSERGELALAILDDTEVKWDGSKIAASGHLIVGVAIRGVVRTVEHEHDFPVTGPIVGWSDKTPKVRCHPGSSTRGTFGAPSRILTGGRCVLVEGMMDFIAAHLAFPNDANAIVGAHSAGMIEHAASVACGRLGAAGELVLVTHADDAGRAAEAKAIAIAIARGVRVTHHLLGQHKDLADQVAAR